jgi:ThiF family
MAQKPLTMPVSLTIDEPQYTRLSKHLFPGDGDEHGAIIVAGIVETPRGTRLLARELYLARDGVDFVPGTYGYRALTPEFIAPIAHACANQELCYLAIHCHGGTDRVEFSSIDMASHERGYPALLDITKGGPVGALVFAEKAVAGDIWTPQGRVALSHATVIGSQIYRLYPSPPARACPADPMYDRNARLFGDIGQEILGGLKVGIIGMGGGGSLLNEWLSHLGVGHIVAVDFDRADLTNLPRLIGTSHWAAWVLLIKSGIPLLQRLGRWLAPHKVHVARHLARRVNPKSRFDPVIGDVVNEATALKLIDCDFLFLASDTMQSRLVFNALVYQYLIPGEQVGAKVHAPDGVITDIHVATRLVMPYPFGGCLACQNAISAAQLNNESLPTDQRRRQRYIEGDDVHEPSVITLNVLSAAQAANDLMMLFTSLYLPGIELRHQINSVQQRHLRLVEPCAEPACRYCGSSKGSRRARGDRASLPCREST